MLEYVFQIKWTNMNVKVSYLMSGDYKTRFFVQHESCKCRSNKSKNRITMNVGVRWLEFL